MHRLRSSRQWALLALPLATALTACSTGAAGPAGTNRGLDSIHQPVVERTTYTLDLIGGVTGLPAMERQRLDAWLSALEAGSGDMLAVDGAVSPAALADVAAITGRHGLLAARADVAVTGLTPPGMLRVAVTRSSAHVPGCPDWADRSASQLDNRTSSNYGCGVNSNMAAMIADPQDLLRGRDDTGRTQAMTSDGAIRTWRAREPGVAKELPRSATLSRGGDQ
ncbi:hypothetical protein PK98_00435 [Croceibacterium mercuriale]|uniref:Pilus assembly protein CpaD n=1 Tax=Croceibacterium mercuriale TaxID=1572751 RepID=A0A0B2BZZ6_9SPHN|nr:CpaD family pilus assembly lipoprotein [Croceibacterium mercuriale]KHL25261.1 hypothetical protein PK98_00435 [Croceibacterium mercuriale]